LALLFAPKSGRAVREQIKNLAEDSAGKMKGYARNAQDKIKTTYDEGKELLKEKKTIISSAIEAGKETIGKEWERYGEEHKKGDLISTNLPLSVAKPPVSC
jgi:gas vesicle protein